MDFDSVLSIASQNQGLSSIPKRYSLKTGPPKKDDKIKGVNSTAVQAFLKKQAMEQKKKEQLHKKEKEDLLAKRVELKSDRKARAMASRTKDNFKGYNGIPIVDQPKKRQSKESGSEDQQRSNTCDEDDDYEDNYDYEGTDSDSDEQSKPVGPPPMAKTEFYNKFETKPKKASAPARSAPPSMNFADLLRLAEKKQFEPVELKVAKKTEERLRTAEEIRELEIERRVKKQDKGKDKPQSSSNSQKKTFESDDRHAKVSRSSEEKYQSSKTSQKQMRQASSERLPTSAKHNGDRNNSSSSGAFNNKGAMNNAAKFNGKQAPRPSQSQKPTPSSDLNPRKGSNSLPQVKSGFLGQSPASGAGRPCQAPHKNPGNVKSGHSSNVGPPQKPANHANSSRPVSSGPPQLGSNGPPRPGSNGPPRPGSNGPPRPGSNGPPRPGSNGPPRPGSNGPPRPGSNAPSRPGSVRPSLGEPSKQPRPGGSMHGHPIPGSSRPANNGPRKMGGISGTPMNSMGSGPGRPPCTVVSETISTKDFAARPGIGQRPAVPEGPKTVIGPSGHRILVRPGPALPPITSSYKRKYEDEEEYDSEMDDFIDDEGEDQNEISKHIREIFGYDRNKYKDESDYALKFMESTWKDQQKEEARSLRMAVLEDQEEERRELEEMQRKNAKKRK